MKAEEKLSKIREEPDSFIILFRSSGKLESSSEVSIKELREP